MFRQVPEFTPACPHSVSSRSLPAGFEARVAFSGTCGLFFALASLLASAFLCFQALTDSFCKIPGVGVVRIPSALKSIRSGALFSTSRTAHALCDKFHLG